MKPETSVKIQVQRGELARVTSDPAKVMATVDRSMELLHSRVTIWATSISVDAASRKEAKGTRSAGLIAKAGCSE